MNVNDLKQTFERVFDRQAERTFFAPGRINLIGEHTDYNGGHVFPLAITFGTYAVAAKREDENIRFYSVNFKDQGIVESSLHSLDYKEADGWTNYPKGMTKLMNENGYAIPSGYDVLFYGNIPNGAGLSSSASIELATGVMLEGLFGLAVDRIEMVKIGQQVENQYIGVNSGIMDQFAIGMGKKGAAIWLDCETLAYEYAPIELPDASIVIMNTNKRRELASSKYNERRSECEEALKRLQTELHVTSLGELTPEQFEKHRSAIGDERLEKRAKHAVYENARTIEALNKLKEGNLEEVGQLMNESHRSLERDYEVTGKELDTLVYAAWEQPGVIGARMTGAGFGGCAIAIVENGHVEPFIQEVSARYKEACGIDAAFYMANIGGGARELAEEEME
ncbi:galactokinase [Domibacillus enclensis]|uniref:Galactokinase n=1 Tax=Domibacillus enclensis TaxID=1017273 RepID=A0A1N7A9K4_9BACI|nr:galactokinase [Domibacillus enclensis]OXS75749.1 galactokinase [Domibacillus enclensis]SIR35795.1 galactokinase [Domibacillus enclensis]